MNETIKGFQGPMPILPTPVASDGTIDEVSLRRLVRYGLRCGAAAIGHFGIASEYHKISDDDRTAIIEILVDEVGGRVPLFVGVAANAGHIAAAYARQAERMGVDLLMLATPQMKMPDRDAMCDYFRRVAGATPLPIIVQDTPVSAPILTAEVTWDLCQELPTLQYVKAEGGDFLTKSVRLMELSEGKVSVIGGAGGRQMIHMLRVGVKAFMTGTEAMDMHAAVIAAYLAGDEEGAARIYYERVLPYFAFYEVHSEELLKEMLYRRGVIDCPDVIAPRAATPMSDVERREFEWVLERINFLTPWPGQQDES